MTTKAKLYSRGSEWRQWDLHIHSPASFEWKGSKRFHQMTESDMRYAVDEMIAALNHAEPAVFALMDYWTFDGWFALKKRLSEQGAPELGKRVFPGIELRLAAPTKCRLNAHVLFSDEVDDQVLLDFKAGLKVEIVGRPLSDTSLRELARMIGEDKLKLHGFKKAEVLQNPELALRAGSIIAEINCDSYREAIEKVPNGKAIGFMPYDTSDGLAEVKWQDHYAYFLGLFKTSPVFETRNSDLRGAFVGEKTAGNSPWFDNFQAGLGNIPRLAVSGSDAHRFIGVKGDNDKRGYGDFPSAKATWIKADPTFLGILQAIKEPAKRSYIGERPPKLSEVTENKTFFLDSIEVSKNRDSHLTDQWLSNCNIDLNPDLVAIIGNKGSGKSALADVIALLGNSRQIDHFSFLSDRRFRQKPKKLAEHFTAKIRWCDQTENERGLFEDPPPESVELVRYIPQAHFEKLCNDHVSGRSDVFEKELRAVIFSHTSPSIRQKALDFDQLIEQQESSFRDQLSEYRKDLKKLNEEIETIENQLKPDIRQSLVELQALKLKQIEEHNKLEPKLVAKPSEQLTPEQLLASAELEKISGRLTEIETQTKADLVLESQLTAKLKATKTIRDRIRLLEKHFRQFLDDTTADLATLGLPSNKIARLAIDESSLNELAVSIDAEQKNLAERTIENERKKRALVAEELSHKTKLNEPQLRYEESLKARKLWQEKLEELRGTAETPESLEGIKARLLQLDNLPALLKEKEAQRLSFTSHIFDILDAQRKAREELFQPVQELIKNNTLIRDEYKLQFQASLGGSPDALSDSLFAIIKQNTGDFRGDESYSTVRKIAEQYHLNNRDDVVKFVSELHKKIVSAANNNDPQGIGIASILRSGKTVSGVNKSSKDVYDLLFGLPFLETRYSLLFQDTQIEQLSPGQRGALLLIFYLLVDKGHNPIILDQPEENLDNETVVSLLVPVLTEAKKRRQIIMVTHNPNLAVVCDAEQVIYSSFDRKNSCRIVYVAGSIENPLINKHVVNVLEGTKPAFDNRRLKYH